jgi:hypothetical protein
MPILQYTTAALNQGDLSISCYANDSPIIPYENPIASAPSTLSSANTAGYPQNARFTPVTPAYNNNVERPGKVRPLGPQQVLQTYEETPENEDLIEDEDSEGYLWETNPSSTGPSSSSRPTHRRTHSANDIVSKNAKRAHTVVERNYRERLNDKIADLALYLFETSSDCKLPFLKYSELPR